MIQVASWQQNATARVAVPKLMTVRTEVAKMLLVNSQISMSTLNCLWTYKSKVQVDGKRK